MTAHQIDDCLTCPLCVTRCDIEKLIACRLQSKLPVRTDTLYPQELNIVLRQQLYDLVNANVTCRSYESLV